MISLDPLVFIREQLYGSGQISSRPPNGGGLVKEIFENLRES